MSQLGEFLSGLYQHHEHQVDEDKQRARKFKSLVDYADVAGIMPKDRAMTMDVDSLEGAVHGYAAKQEFQKNAEQIKLLQNKQEEDNAMAAFAGKLIPMMEKTNALPALADPGQTGNPSLDAILQFAQQGQEAASPMGLDPRMATALAGMGRTDPRLAATVMRSILPQVMGANSLTPGTYKVPGSGALFAYRGNQMFPAGYELPTGGDATADAGLQMAEKHDENGRLIGWAMTDRRGNSRFYPNKLGPMEPAVTPDGQRIEGYYLTPSGGSIDARSLMEKSGFEMKADGSFGAVTTPAPGAAGAPGQRGGIPVVTEDSHHAAVKSGKVYYDKAGNLRRKK